MSDKIIPLSAPTVPHMASIKEAAQLTGLAEYHIRRLCIGGEISAVKTGRKYLVNVDRLIDYLNAPPTAHTANNGAIRHITE